MDEGLIPVRESQRPGVIADLPRREFLDASLGDASLSQMRFNSFKVSHFRSFTRLLDWFQLILFFFLGILGDVLSRRDTPKRRAARLRSAFEREGGSFVKLGLHLSMRLDASTGASCHGRAPLVRAHRGPARVCLPDTASRSRRSSSRPSWISASPRSPPGRPRVASPRRD